MSEKMTLRRQLLSQFWLVLAGLFVILPLLWILRLAFDGSLDGSHVARPQDAAFWPHELSGSNFAHIWSQPITGFDFMHLLINSLLVAGSTTLIALVCGLTAGYAFARFRFPGRRLGLFAALLMITTPPAGLAIPFFLILNDWHFRNTLFAMIIVYSAVAFPFAVWVVRNAVQSVPLEIEQAAMLEGANRLNIFGRVTLPLIVPSVAVAGFIGFTLGWSEFALAWALIDDPHQETLAMALFNMRSATGVPWGSLGAMTVLVALPVIVLFYLLGRYVIAGLSLGTATTEIG